jgi:hypothetical protein
MQSRELLASHQPPLAARPEEVRDMRARRSARRLRNDEGMATAEYAVGTVAACGFGGILYKLLTSDAVMKLLKEVIERAFSFGF